MSASDRKLERIVYKNPTSILFARLADQYLGQGDTRRAIEVCRRGLRYRPSYATGHLVMGRCFLAADRLEEARQEFQKVLRLDADNVAALLALGRIDTALGNRDLAAAHFLLTLKIDPHNPVARDELGVLAGGRGGSAPSRAPKDGTAETVPPVCDTDPPSLRASAEEADAPEGVTPPVQAETEAHEDPGRDGGQPAAGPFATRTLADLYAAQGHVGQALTVLEEVLHRDPGDEAARERLVQLSQLRSTA